jgi:hypothetical protein
MKTTVDLPQALLAAAKDCAVASGLTLQEVIEAGLRKVLDAARGRKPFKLRKCSVGGEGLAPGMDWPRIREEIYRGRGA